MSEAHVLNGFADKQIELCSGVHLSEPESPAVM